MIKKTGILLVSVLLMTGNHSVLAEQEIPMKPVTVNIKDKESLQRGARLYMNYCSGCHSLKYMRYNRMAEELGLTTFDGELDEDLLKNNLIFTQATIYDPVQIAMAPEDAKQWFGMVPPDLSLSARDRGPVWIYNYLKGFYSDSSRPFGTNNILIPDVAMPNILEPLLGKVVLVQNKDAHTADLLLVKSGEMHQAEFDDAVQDLVTFLVYVGEPAKMVRYKIGVFVMIFLFILFIVAYQLKKSYWRRLH